MLSHLVHKFTHFEPVLSTSNVYNHDQKLKILVLFLNLVKNENQSKNFQLSPKTPFPNPTEPLNAWLFESADVLLVLYFISSVKALEKVT